MPNLLDAETIRIAAAAQRAAYGERWSTVDLFFENLLEQSNWSLIGPYNSSNGFYINGNAAVFAVRRGDTVVISIRGSATELDTVPPVTISQDWYSASASPQSYYDRIAGFISSVLASCDTATKIILTGHSLGAQAATIGAIQTVNNYIVSGAIQAVNVSVVLFGTPNIPSTIVNSAPDWLSSRLMSFVNSDDLIPIIVPTHQEVEPNIVAHLIDETGRFDNLVNTFAEHNQSAYYQLWTDISYFEFFNEWRAAYHGGLTGIYGLNSNVLSPVAAYNDTYHVDGLNGLFLGLFGNDYISLLPFYTGVQFASGGLGDDTLVGGAGTDYLDGGSGVDHLSGRDGADFLAGGSGNDGLSGQGGDDHLIGGAGSDRYNVGLNEGYDIIDDRGGAGEDVLVLYTGQLASAFDPSWFTRAPDNPNDMLIRIPNGPNAWHVDIRIINAGTSAGGIETIQIRSGADEALTANTSLSAIWARLAQPAPAPGPTAPTVPPQTYEGPPGTTGSIWSGGAGSQFWQGANGSETAYGGFDFDVLDGGEGNDIIFGGSGGALTQNITDPSARGDFLRGGAGDDLIVDDDLGGPYDSDIIWGGSGDDFVIVRGGARDEVWGQEGYDTLLIDYSDETRPIVPGGFVGVFENGVPVRATLWQQVEAVIFYGGSGDDQLVGGTERGFLYGGRGNDSFQADRVGGGVADGGEGDDNWSGWFDAVTADIIYVADDARSSAGFTLFNGTTIRNIEQAFISTGSGNDIVWAGAGGNGQYQNGRDYFLLHDGSDTYYARTGYADGGSGSDLLVMDASGTSAAVTAGYDSNLNNYSGSGGLFQFSSTNFEAITFRGGSGSDSVRGRSGDDNLFGDAGDDVLSGMGGADTIDGGQGFDWASLDLSTQTRDVRYYASSAASSSGLTLVDGTVVLNIEGVSLRTGSGNDQFWMTGYAQPSNDVIYYDIFAGDGDDTLSSDGRGQNNFHGEAGMDRWVIDFSWSDERVDTGITFASYYLAYTGTTPAGHGSPLNYSFGIDIESVTVTGGSANDRLTGLAGADVLRGAAGEDTLSGGEGADMLDGGGGDDTLTGGLGDDLIDGGSGHDILIVSGAASGYRLLMDGDNFILKGPDGGDRLTGVESIRFSDGRVLELNRMYGPDVDTRAWADGRIPEALLSGGVGSGERPLVLPGPAGNDLLVGKDGGGPEVLPGADDGDGWVWKDDDAPLVLPGAEDVFVVGAKGFDGPEVLPGVDDWMPAGAKGFDQPEVLPALDERTLFTFDRAALFDRWSGQMLTVDEQGLVVDRYIRGDGWGSDGWSF